MSTLTLSSVSKLPQVRDRVVGLDTEGDGLDRFRCRPHYLVIAVDGAQFMCRWDDTLVKWLTKNLPTMAVAVAHYVKFDLHMFFQGGIKWEVIRDTKVYCTMLSDILIDGDLLTYALEAVAQRRLGRGKVQLVLEKYGLADKSQIINLPINKLVEYGCRDGELLIPIRDSQLIDLKNEELEKVHALEMEVVKTIVHMERRGTPVDLGRAEKAGKKLDFYISELQRKADKMAGFNVNVLSHPQMGQAFENMGLEPPPGDKPNSVSFSKDRLEAIDHPFSETAIELRSVRKMKETFVNGVHKFLNSKTGRIHTNFNQLKDPDNQVGTGTGRMSSSEPNMQQIPNPKRGHAMTAQIVRSMFVSPPGYCWGCRDWSQFEFRIFAHYSGDQVLIGIYQKDPATDFHQATSDLTGVPRNPHAKQINLGLVFGMGDGKLAMKLKLPYSKGMMNGKTILIPGPEAKAIFQQYHTKFPGAKKILKQAANLAKNRGYVKTVMGRRLRFPGGIRTHKAGGLVFQGTAADLMKKKLVELDRESILEQLGVELILTVHDEFDLLIPDESVKKVSSITEEIMNDIPELKVPVLSSMGIGRDWYEASKE